MRLFIDPVPKLSSCDQNILLTFIGDCHSRSLHIHMFLRSPPIGLVRVRWQLSFQLASLENSSTHYRRRFHSSNFAALEHSARTKGVLSLIHRDIDLLRSYSRFERQEAVLLTHGPSRIT